MNRRILATLSCGHLATDLPQGAIPALLPLFRSEYHLSYTQLGLIVLLANVSSSVIQPLFGILSDRMKMYWLMPAGTLVASAGMVLAVAAARQYSTVVAMIFLSGLGVAAFHPEGYKYAGLASGAGRATGMSYFSVGGNFGYGLGPLATTVAIALWGKYGIAYSLPLAIAASIMMWRVVSPWAAGAHAELPAGGASPARRPARANAPRTAAWIVGLLVTFVVLRSWVQVGTASYIPLYFTGVRHMNATYAGMLVSVFLAAGGVGTLLGGMAADRWGHRAMLIVSMAILPPFLWLLPRTAGIWPVLAALIGGMAVVSTFAVAMVMAQNVIPQRIGLISGLIIGFAVGMGGVGTTLLGGIADRWGVLRAMDVTALLPAAALAIALVLPKDAGAERNSAPRSRRTSMSGADAPAGGS